MTPRTMSAAMALFVETMTQDAAIRLLLVLLHHHHKPLLVPVLPMSHVEPISAPQQTAAALMQSWVPHASTLLHTSAVKTVCCAVSNTQANWMAAVATFASIH